MPQSTESILFCCMHPSIHCRCPAIGCGNCTHSTINLTSLQHKWLSCTNVMWMVTLDRTTTKWYSLSTQTFTQKLRHSAISHSLSMYTSILPYSSADAVAAHGQYKRTEYFCLQSPSAGKKKHWNAKTNMNTMPWRMGEKTKKQELITKNCNKRNCHKAVTRKKQKELHHSMSPLHWRGAHDGTL